MLFDFFIIFISLYVLSKTIVDFIQAKIILGKTK